MTLIIGLLGENICRIKNLKNVVSMRYNCNDLDVKKTKQMIINFQVKKLELISDIKSYKYLDTFVDDRLNKVGLKTSRSPLDIIKGKFGLCEDRSPCNSGHIWPT